MTRTETSAERRTRRQWNLLLAIVIPFLFIDSAMLAVAVHHILTTTR